MNPQSIVFLKLTESTVGALPTERKSEFQFGIGESDMIGLVCGIVGTVACQWLYRKLRSRPVAWAERRTVKIYDLEERDTQAICHDDSADDLHSVVFGRCQRVPSMHCGD